MEIYIFSSANSLSDKPVSYKDDIFAMCYYLIDSYKGKLPWHALSGDNKDKKKYIEMKNKYIMHRFYAEMI